MDVTEENDGFDIAPSKTTKGAKRGRKPGRRGPGRPRAGVKTTQVTRQEYIEPEDDDDEDEGAGAPLFDDMPTEGDAQIVRIRVTRTDPPEGMLGYLDDVQNASEKEISERWGGSVYSVQGIDARGRVRKVRSLRIAGDPIFVSTMADLQWRKTRERLGGGPQHSSNGNVAPGGMSMTEMLAFWREQDNAKAAAEAATRERLAAIERETEERRRREDVEREERRRRDDDERDRRRAADSEAALKAQQAFTAQMIATMQAANSQSLDFIRTTLASKPAASEGHSMIEALKMIAVVKEAFPGSDGGGEESMDPLAIIARHGGEWLQGIGAAVGGAIREVKHKPGEPVGALPGQPAQLVAPQGLALPPTLAPKVASLVNKIVSAGQDPEVVMGGILDHLNREMEGRVQGAPGPAAAGPQPRPVDVVPRTAPLKPPTPIGVQSPTGNPQPVNREVDGNGVVRMGFGR